MVEGWNGGVTVIPSSNQVGLTPMFQYFQPLRSTRRLSYFKKIFNMKKDWPLWEVFIRSKNGLSHKHVGSLHAADARMAIENARDVYTRRSEGVSIWVVESVHITASDPDQSESLFDPAADKIYRHPTFYDLPDEVKHI
jgi:ring-1,2-phenylacetyl-CoA epoxidase subunit PaaB